MNDLDNPYSITDDEVFDLNAEQSTDFPESDDHGDLTLEDDDWDSNDDRRLCDGNVHPQEYYLQMMANHVQGDIYSRDDEKQGYFH